MPYSPASELAAASSAAVVPPLAVLVEVAPPLGCPPLGEVSPARPASKAASESVLSVEHATDSRMAKMPSSRLVCGSLMNVIPMKMQSIVGCDLRAVLHNPVRIDVVPRQVTQRCNPHAICTTGCLGHDPHGATASCARSYAEPSASRSGPAHVQGGALTNARMSLSCHYFETVCPLRSAATAAAIDVAS